MMKKKSKKLLLWLFVLTFVLTGIAGCGTKQKDDQEAASTETAGAISGVDDIVGKKIGVQLGTTGDIYVSDYENDGSGTTVERYNKGADAVQALKQGKIDCVVIDEQPALAFVEENPGLKILDEEFTLEEYAIVIAKGNDDLLEKVNTALEELRSEGTLDRITKNYIGTDAEKGNYPYEPQDVSRGNGTLTMGTNAEFPPYEYYENNEIVGIDVDIMQAIADKLGMELKIEDMAFDSIIPAVSTGKIDVGAAGFTVTEERKKNVNFTDTYATSKQVIIVRDGNAVTAKSSFGEKFYQNFIQDNRYAYMLKGLGKPVVFTGSQLPIEHSDTDAKINLFDAVCFACENVSGVYVVFNGIVIYGTHARKIKTTSFDAFESANIEAAAKVVNGVVVYSGEFSKEKHRYIEYNKYSENDKSDNDSNDTGLYADTDMCEDIMVLKLFPGIKTDIFDYIKEHYRGVIIESFGIGGIPCTAGDEENDSNSSVAEKIGELTEAGIAVVITTQCMYEGVSLDVYEVGHILARQNVIVAKDMTTEAVTMKLMWALAHYTKMTDVKEFMEAFNVESARMATQYIVDKLGEGI